jgi:hypothetical protein
MTRPRPTDNSNWLSGLLGDAFRLVEFALVGPPSPCKPGEVTGAFLRVLLFLALFFGAGSVFPQIRLLFIGGAQFRSDAGTQHIVRPLDGLTGPAKPVR